MTTRSKSTLFAGRSTFAVLASGAIHGALTWAVTGLAAAAPPPPSLETLAIEMLAPEEPAPPMPVEPPEPSPVEELAPPEPTPAPPPEPDVAEPDVAAPVEEPSEPESSEAESSEPESSEADSPGLDANTLLAGNGATEDGATGFGARGGGRPSGRGRSTPKSAPRREAKRAPPPAPAPVPFQDLSRRPQPPRLDALLEHNYPPGARRQGRAGSARVALLIGLDGRVRSVRVVSATEPEFGDACARTLRQSRWSPPQDDQGNAVPTVAPYECRFRVER